MPAESHKTSLLENELEQLLESMLEVVTPELHGISLELIRK